MYMKNSITPTRGIKTSHTICPNNVLGSDGSILYCTGLKYFLLLENIVSSSFLCAKIGNIIELCRKKLASTKVSLPIIASR